MVKQSSAKIIAFVGMPGAGKTSAIDYLSEKNIPRVYFGGVVLDALTSEGYEINPANEKMMREKLRRTHGNDVIVNRIITQIEDLIGAGQKQILADGLYSWTEYKALKQAFAHQVIVVGVTAPRKVRHKRLALRPVRPLNRDEASKRDWAEIENLEKGGPIAVADYYVNNNEDLDFLHSQIDELTKEINF